MFLPTGIAAAETGVVMTGWLGSTRDGEWEAEGRTAWTGDERDWTTRGLGAGSALASVARGADGWVGVGGQDEQMLVVRSDDGLAWTDVLATAREGSAMQVVSGPITVLTGCTGGTPVCPSEVWRLEPDGTLTPLGLGGIGPGEVVGLDGLALSPEGELLVVGSIAQGFDGPETSTLWWSGPSAPVDVAGRGG